jgi:hypothetical protein
MISKGGHDSSYITETKKLMILEASTLEDRFFFFVNHAKRLVRSIFTLITVFYL